MLVTADSLFMLFPRTVDAVAQDFCLKPVLPSFIQKNKGGLPTAVLGVVTFAGQRLAQSAIPVCFTRNET